MPSLLPESTWSRATTAEPSGSEGCPSEVPSLTDASALATGDFEAFGPLVIPRFALQELLADSIRGLTFAVMITSPSAYDSSPVVHAVSRGAVALYEYPRRLLLGESWRILDVQEAKGDLQVAAKLRAAEIHGAETMVVRTQRRSSGELFKVCQYHRGLSFGSDPLTGEEVWYLLTIGFGITSEFKRGQRSCCSVDYDFYQEAAISIAALVKASITKRILDRLSEATLWGGEALTRGGWDEGNEASDDDAKILHVMYPGWVVCPPASDLLLAGF